MFWRHVILPRIGSSEIERQCENQYLVDLIKKIDFNPSETGRVTRKLYLDIVLSSTNTPQRINTEYYNVYTISIMYIRLECIVPVSKKYTVETMVIFSTLPKSLE